MKKVIFLFLVLPFLGLGQVQIGDDIDGEAEGDFFGQSVWLSSDGTILAVGALRSDSPDLDSGSVSVYENIGGVWTPIDDVINGESLGDNLGFAVSLSSDGSILAASAPYNDTNGEDSGQVSIYENIGGVWTQIGTAINGESAEDKSGFSLSLSSDGSIVAIGSPFSDGNGSNSGHVSIYENVGGIWTQLGNDIDGENSEDYSGNGDFPGSNGISLSSDGSIVAIGAYLNDGNGSNSGHVRIFEFQNNVWSQIGDNIDGEAAGDKSGVSVNLSSDGTIVAIGATSNSQNGVGSGHVRIFKFQDNTWTQIGQDIDGEAAGDISGISVRLSSDGSIVAIGAYLNDGNGSNSGHVRIYKDNNGIWTQIGQDIDGEGAGDGSGLGLSLSSTGEIVAIGAGTNISNGNVIAGHVRVYDLSAVLSTEAYQNSSFKLYPNPSKTQFTIQLEPLVQLHKVSIYNTLGQVVLTSEELIVNTSTLTSGSYIVEILTNKGKASKKLIIY